MNRLKQVSESKYEEVVALNDQDASKVVQYLLSYARSNSHVAENVVNHVRDAYLDGGSSELSDILDNQTQILDSRAFVLNDNNNSDYERAFGMARIMNALSILARGEGRDDLAEAIYEVESAFGDEIDVGRIL